MLKIIKEDLIDHVKEYDAVLVAANLYSSMLEGFAYDVKSQYPYVYEDNLKFPYGDTSKYGTVVESTREDQPIFALCYIFAINTNPKTIKCTLNYEALENCLKVVNVLYKDKHIGMTIMGACKFEGNGERDKIMEIIERSLTSVDADIYDYEQITSSYKWVSGRMKAMEIFHEEGKSQRYLDFVKESRRRFGNVEKKNRKKPMHHKSAGHANKERLKKKLGGYIEYHKTNFNK